MDPAEEIVTCWLKQKGYFMMNEIRTGNNKEIDILAMNPRTRHKLHVEVHVSIDPVGGLRAKSPAKFGGDPLPERIRGFCLKKFSGVEDEVKEKFGTDEYEKILIVGELHKTDPREEVEKELRKYCVKLVDMRVVLKEVLEELENKKKKVYMDDTRRYIQILSTFLEKG